jgi:hypothetical protein
MLAQIAKEHGPVMANLVFAYVRKQAAALLEVIRDRDSVGKMLVPSWFAYDLDAPRTSFSCTRERTCDVSKMSISAVSLRGDNSPFSAQEAD